MNKNKIGIVQGRLSPTINNKIQAFPFHTWQDEFTICKKNWFLWNRMGYGFNRLGVEPNIV